MDIKGHATPHSKIQQQRGWLMLSFLNWTRHNKWNLFLFFLCMCVVYVHNRSIFLPFIHIHPSLYFVEIQKQEKEKKHCEASIVLKMWNFVNSCHVSFINGCNLLADYPVKYRGKTWVSFSLHSPRSLAGDPLCYISMLNMSHSSVNDPSLSQFVQRQTWWRQGIVFTQHRETKLN